MAHMLFTSREILRQWRTEQGRLSFDAFRPRSLSPSQSPSISPARRRWCRDRRVWELVAWCAPNGPGFSVRCRKLFWCWLGAL